MLTKITIRNFKSFRRAEIELGAMNLLVGANASGKSNFFDALRVLQGIGSGFTVREILDGKPKTDTSETWEGIRGGAAMSCFRGVTEEDTFEIETSGAMPGSEKKWRHAVAFAPRDGRVARESLSIGVPLYETTVEGDVSDPVIWAEHFRGTRGGPPHRRFDRARPLLRQFAEKKEVSSTHRHEVSEIARQLADMQRIDPLPSVLREYSRPLWAARMGDVGQNFAAVVAAICAVPQDKKRYLEWLRAFRPQEVEDVGTLAGAVGEPLFMIVEGGRPFPASVLSEGILRFAAIVAAFYQPSTPGILIFEEIEKGIHANRARLLMELIRRHSAGDGPQTLVTTNSPAVLEWLQPDEHATTFFFRRDPETGHATICPLPALDYFESASSVASVAELFTEGWMEAAS